MKKLIALPLLIVSLLPCAAQNTRQVLFRTLCLEHVENIHEVAMPGPKDPKEMVSIPIYTASFSSVVQGTFDSNQVVFYSPEKSSDGKPLVVARGNLAKGARQLFLFVPTGGGEGKPAYEIKAFDDDTTSFKMGSVRAINLSPVAVRFTVSGAKSPEIPPGRHAQFPQPSKVNEYNMYPAAVEFLSGDGKWVVAQSTSWKASQRRREIVITLVNKQFKQPEVRMYPDIPPWLEAAPQP